MSIQVWIEGPSRKSQSGKRVTDERKRVGRVPSQRGSTLGPFNCPICGGVVSGKTRRRHEVCAQRVTDEQRVGSHNPDGLEEQSPSWDNAVRRLEDGVD